MNGTTEGSRTNVVILTAVIIMFVFVTAASATNGYFSHGYGTIQKGMAGVGAAIPQNALTPATNPAGIAYLGNRIDIGLSLFSPIREFTVDGIPSGEQSTFGLTPQNLESDSKFFVIPSVGVTRWIGENALGLALYGNGGMNTNYDDTVFHGTGPTGVDLSQLFAGFTWAREAAVGHAFGVTGILAYQRFEAKGLQAFAGFSRDSDNLTNNEYANSFGVGVRIGYLGYILPELSVGLSYQTRTFMSEFDEYAGLFAENGDFDIPSNVTFGVGYQPIPELTLGLDIQYIRFSEIASVGNPMNPADFQSGILLGDDDGAGFGWDDVTVFKLGGQWDGVPGWSFRGGYSFGSQPVLDSEVMFNILAPGVIEHHLTVGASKDIGGQTVHLSIARAIGTTVDGPNPMEIPGAQTIELTMDQWDIELGLSF